MQLKGLVRFFTILLILYSIYELSFTWFVRSHENKMTARAERWVNSVYPTANKETKEMRKAERLRILLDSTKDETVSYGFTGAISYDRAKREELNLGLDLKGGMHVTMEVELQGLLRSLASNSTDTTFVTALERATARKANSGADYISLFVEEYKKASGGARLAPLFASGSRITVNDTDDKVVSELRSAASDAFDNTYKVIQTRIDKFGVAQPNINKDAERGIITVELPGIQDPERVRRYLQSSANLQFWEVYKPEELMQSWMTANTTYQAIVAGRSLDSAQTMDTSKNARNMFQDFKFDLQNSIVALSDTAGLMNLLRNPAVNQAFPNDAKFVWGQVPRDNSGKASKFLPLYVLRTKGQDVAPIEGDVIESAQQSYDQLGSKPTVTMDMDANGAAQWERLTETSYKESRPIAIVLDDIVYSAPIAHNGKITGGRTEISGNFQLEEAQDLANILKAGRLPAPAKIVSEQQVGPTLGAEAIKGGALSFIISFVVIFLLMLVYYNTSGWVANIALVLNLLFTIGILTGLGATLTAPGIAGLVLTIGMAVDTNVIIYERIKEELTKGKGYIPAVNEGYRRSLPPVLDAHVTTLLTAIILFSFGLGPVKGFATTQIIGIILSLFCGILVSRWVTDWFTNKKRHLEYFTPVSRRIFKNANFKFIEYRKIAYGISFVVLALGVGAIFNGFDQGVEFKGGRSYQVRFDQPIKEQIPQVRKDLTAALGEAPIIKTIGTDSRQLDITTTHLITQQGADAKVEQDLVAGLKNYLPAGTTVESFAKNHRLGFTKVEPTISDKLKRDAQWATFWSVLIIAIYIFIRFRDWRYSLGTIVALLHDVLVTLAVFSFLRNVVPFPLELDQHFIAAILTVIGFSMNDTVIVFDRIREYSREMVGAPKEVVINKAINETLSRTIMTSLTVFLTILILFLFGGDVTRGFAFAMLIGVITGTYSSIFVAAPILVDLGSKKAIGANDPGAVEKPSAKARPEVAKS